MAQHLALVEASLQQIVAQKSAFAEAFSERLVAAFPQLQSRFALTDMCFEQHTLIATLTWIADFLKHPEPRIASLQELGVRHDGYRVRSQDYVMMGSALLEALAAFLGEAWSQEVCNAWIEAYGAVATLMVLRNALPASDGQDDSPVTQQPSMGMSSTGSRFCRR